MAPQDRASSRTPVSLADLKRRRDEAARATQSRERVKPKGHSRLFREAEREDQLGKTQHHDRKKETAATTAAGFSSDCATMSLSIRKDLKRPRSPAAAADDVDAREREVIRMRYMPDDYLNGKRDPRARSKDKGRFRFEWDPEEDTSVVFHGADSAYDSLVHTSTESGPAAVEVGWSWRKRGTSKDVEFNPPGRASDANPYGDAPQSQRHWSQKSLADMTERDWAIFREDHGISYRGFQGVVMPARTRTDDSHNAEHDSVLTRIHPEHQEEKPEHRSQRIAVTPARSWQESGLSPEFLRLLVDVAHYKRPTPIQMAAIPVVLQGRDLIGLAETGSGKTAAFVLPMIAQIRKFPPLIEGDRSGIGSGLSSVTSHDALRPQRRIFSAADGPYGLVLAPTRELVLQTEEETRKFAKPFGIRVTAIIGGQGLEEQGMALQAGSEIVICTPGRMVDLLSRRLAALGNCCFLVLDEADRMVDMGFEPQVQEIIAAIPLTSDIAATERSPTGGDRAADDVMISVDMLAQRRQTLMFSATMSPSIERIAKEYLSKPLIISVGRTGKAAEAVEQHVEILSSEGRKRERLADLIETLDPPIIVFVNTKKGCEDVARFIESRCGKRPVVLHSGKSQDQREEHLEGFRTGRFGIVVATDVLGRGIDIKGVNHVINFELPKTIAPYTHRIGRTGRAGRKGSSWSLATNDDADIFADLKALLEESGAPIPKALARHESVRAASLRNIID